MAALGAVGCMAWAGLLWDRGQAGGTQMQCFWLPTTLSQTKGGRLLEFMTGTVGKAQLYGWISVVGDTHCEWDVPTTPPA